MKKSILLLAVATIFAFTAEAQTNKQVAGSKSMEIQFAPLGNNPFSINGIKYRSFKSETSAIRLTANINYNSSSDPILNGNVLPLGTDFGGSDSSEVEMFNKSRAFGLTLRPGMEWHLVGTDKLSPYYGAEAIIGYSTTTQLDDYYNVHTNDAGDLVESVQQKSLKNSTMTLGLSGVAGLDYYFAQNIFLGAELSYGFTMVNQGDSKFEDDGNSDSFSFSEAYETPNGKSFGFNPSVLGQMRLGIIF